MLRFGLVGKDVSHSYSKAIFEYLFSYTNIKGVYDLVSTDIIDKSLFEKYNGMNITMPYKLKVKEILDLEADYSINVIKNNNGKFEAFNTDLYGFDYSYRKLVGNANINSAIVLGSGAMGQMVVEYFENMGIKCYVVSRNPKSGQYCYSQIMSLTADIIINTTPVGMYPEKNASPVSASIFKNVSFAFDMIYRPYNTKFILDAKLHHVKVNNGIEMLIMQALQAFEIWTGKSFKQDERQEILFKLMFKLNRRFLLIGMPFSGKTSYLQLLGNSNLVLVDLDKEIELSQGKCIKEIINDQSIEYFREIESIQAIRVAKLDNCIVASGGGLVTNYENLSIFSEFIFIFLDTELNDLITRYHMTPHSRPLIKSEQDVIRLYKERIDLYEKYHDIKMSEVRKFGGLNAILF